jgi:hypothetical protein
MPKSAKKKKVINNPKKRTAKKKAISKVMKGGANMAGGAASGIAIHQRLAAAALHHISPLVPGIPETSQPETSQKVEDLINNLIGLTPEERRHINAEHFNNLFNTIGDGYDLLSQVLGDPGGGFLKRIFNLGDDFKYDKLRNFMLGGSSNITQCSQTVGKKDVTMGNAVPCIWCGAPLDDASECEHVLPVVAAALLLTFSGGPNPELKTIIEWLLEYGWAHQLCNQVKSNDLFITTIKLPGGRMFVPDFNVLVERFYKVVKTNNSKCWSPTPRTNPELSKLVKYNCNALLTDITRINQGHMVYASNPNIQIRGDGIAFMGEKRYVYPANLFFRKINVDNREPDNRLGNLVLSESSFPTKPEFLFPSGPPTSLLHLDDDINLGIKGHPIVFLFNICRYLNRTKGGLLAGDKSAQQEALMRFFTGIRPEDLLSILSNTTKLIVDQTLKDAYLATVTEIQRDITAALPIFIKEERNNQRTLLVKVIRMSRRSGRSEKEVEKAVKKRVGVYEKTFKKFEQDLKKLKRVNKATYDAIIMSFNQNNIPKSFNEFNTYVNHCVLDELNKTLLKSGGGIGKKIGKKGGAQLTVEQQQVINSIELDLLVSCFIGESIKNIIKIMRVINKINEFYTKIIINYFQRQEQISGSILQQIGQLGESKVPKVLELFKTLHSTQNPDLAFKLAYSYGYAERNYITGYEFLTFLSSPNFKYQTTDIFADAEKNALAHSDEILPYLANLKQYSEKYFEQRKASSSAGGDEVGGTTTSVLLNLYRPAQVAQAAAGRIRKKSQKNKKAKKNKKKPTKKKKNTNKN